MTIEPKIGDSVYHTCNEFLYGEIIADRDIAWEIKYPDDRSNGSWLKKYTVVRVKEITRPQSVEFSNVDTWMDALRHFYKCIHPATKEMRPKREDFNSFRDYVLARNMWRSSYSKYKSGEWWKDREPGEIENSPKPRTPGNSAWDRIKNTTEQFNQETINKNLENEMRAEIEHKIEINGRDITEMSASDILHAIGNVQDRIEKMSQHKDKSRYVIQETQRLEKFVVEAYEILDDKFAGTEK